MYDTRPRPVRRAALALTAGGCATAAILVLGKLFADALLRWSGG